MNKKIAIVARVSTVDKQDYSRQVDDLTTIIKTHGHSESDIEIFADKISGYSKSSDRPEFSRLLSNLEKFKAIYVTEISRLGRNPSEVRKTIDELTDLKIPVYIQQLSGFTVDEEGSRHATISIILQVFMEFANEESERMKQRSKSGLLRSAKLGRAGGGASLAYGYKSDENKMLVIEPDEAKIISKIFDLYLKGNGLKVIANHLNDIKIPTRSQLNYTVKGQGWVDNVILGILKNTLYKGERNFKGHIFEAPAIITPEIFERCTEIRKGKTHRNYLTTYEYLLKDLIKCGCCGSNYYAKFKPTLRGDKVYKCASTIRKTIGSVPCENKGINISLIESAIYDQLIKAENIMPHLNQVKDMVNNFTTELESSEMELLSAENNLAKKRKEAERLITLFTSGVFEIDLLTERKQKSDDAINKLVTKIKSLKKKITDLKISIQNNSEASISKSIIVNAANSRSELREIFNQFVHKVIVNEIDKGLVLASIFIRVDGIVLKVPLKLILDKQILQTKKKDKPNRYIPFRSLVNEPVYRENKLLVNFSDIAEEIKAEMKFNPWVTCETVLKVIDEVKVEI